MDYELAKELKDAGFPQQEPAEYLFNPANELETAKAPTLEELIEACGDDFDSLHKNYTDVPMGAPGKWLAEATQRTGWCCVEDSAEKALAQLWLALNKK